MRGISSICVFFIFAGCVQNSANLKGRIGLREIPELLVYCENGLVSPISEISTSFEELYNCKVRIHNDCARNIINIINYSKKGDVFIPDCRTAISWIKQIDSLVVVDSLYIGMNQMVMIVKKDNPLLFSGKLESMAEPKYAVMLANPETSSLGYETMKLLIDNNIYNETMSNTMTLTVDSKGLKRSIINNEASVAIDWVTSYMGNEDNGVDTFSIDKQNEQLMVYASVLRNSEYLGLAYSFMAVLTSPQSLDIFAKYGIRKHKSTIY